MTIALTLPGLGFFENITDERGPTILFIIFWKFIFLNTDLINHK